MMKFHAMGGLPRAGSTLLCNILNQNPRFHASGTSILPQLLSSMAHIWTGAPEIKRDLAHDKEGTEKRLVNIAKAMVEAMYAGKEVVFDKSRGWGHNHMILAQLFPDAKLLCCVRDLRGVFSSIEKEHQKFPLLDTAQTPQEKTLYARADSMFAPQGIIGQPIDGVEDILRRKPDNVLIVQYETFVKSPQLVLERIYSSINEPYFKHNFKSVASDSEDAGVYDAIHLNKFPHTVHGKVQARESSKSFISDDVERLIMDRFASYNRAFGYA